MIHDNFCIPSVPLYLPRSYSPFLTIASFTLPKSSGLFTVIRNITFKTENWLKQNENIVLTVVLNDIGCN